MWPVFKFYYHIGRAKTAFSVTLFGSLLLFKVNKYYVFLLELLN